LGRLLECECGMPLYEYKCHKCGKTIEVLQKFSDEPLRTHEDCGGEVERLISASAFHLKGSGWYATDYAKSNGEPGAAEKADKAEKKADDKKAEDKKTESKPSESASGSSTETKTESKSEAKPAATESKTAAKPAAPAADLKP
jgi:putative FmdB family regulatory protein